MAKEIRDYKIKEALSNLGQKLDHLKGIVADMQAKFDILVEVLNEREEERNAEKESQAPQAETP